MLGAIVEAVSRRSYASYVQASIFAPLSMRDSHVDQTIALDREQSGRLSSGHVYVFGFPVARTLPHEGDRLPTAALISSAADMGRFLVAQLRTDSSDVLSAAGFAQMHAGGAPSNGFSYAFGWRDGTIAGERAVHHGGIVPHFRGKIVMLPDRRLGVVVLTNVSSAIPWPIAPTSHVMADEIAAALMGVTLPVPSDTHRGANRTWPEQRRPRPARRQVDVRESGNRGRRRVCHSAIGGAVMERVAVCRPRRRLVAHHRGHNEPRYRGSSSGAPSAVAGA